MKHKRIEQVRGEGLRGFSGWIYPAPDNYILVCCDCSLAHEVQFRAVKVVKRGRNGRFLAKTLRKSEYRVAYRARRAERYTARERARKAKK